MEYRKRKGLSGIFSGLWRGLDATRRVVLNLVFLVLVIAVLGALASGGGGPEVPDSTALVIAPRGEIVEQLAGDPVQRAFDKLTGNETPETLLSDLIKAIRAAKDDERVKAILLDLNSMSGAWLSKLQVLRTAIDDFKASGKPVIASGDSYDKSQYYLATTADEIYLHEMGLVLLDGYGRFRAYHKEGIDRLELDMNVIRVGEFKSAVEPFLRDGMSDEAKEANLDWLGDLWKSYLEDVAAARNLTPQSLQDGIDRFNENLRAADGQGSQVALESGLVDHVGGRNAVRERMIELVGQDEDDHSFNRIGHSSYLEAVGDDEDGGTKGGKVAVIVAKGSILNGDQPPGAIGGDSTAALIREARNDEDVKALVLRVDSGGGSAFASEVIRNEFVLARESGKKVVVSMGSLAASGGYWISTASDKIWANPNTITGSIGIFGMLPTYHKPLAKHMGTRVDGVGTTWLAGQGRPDRELDPAMREAVQQIIEKGYREFLERVSQARGVTPEEVDKIARGRVWSGYDARELGLVDQLGGLDDAIESAARLAEMGDDYRVEYMEKEVEWKDRMMADMLSQVADWYQPESRAPLSTLERTAVDYFRRHLELFSQFDDPFGMYAHCLCEVD